MLFRSLVASRMKMKSLHGLGAMLVTLTISVGVSGSAHAEALKLTVKDVVDRVLVAGHDRKLIDFTYQQSEFPLYQALGQFDPTLFSSYSHEQSRLETLSGISNPEDKTTVWKAGVSKKLPSGTIFSTEYSRTKQDSVLNSFTSSLRPSSQVLDQFDFSIRQNILGNFFGVLDRERVQIAERSVQRAELDKYESTEDLVLLAVRSYWTTFAAKEALQENIQAREKYRQLVSSLRRKFGKGIDDDRAELPKAQAELANQDRAVKSASLTYLNALDSLFTLMNVPPADDVDFIVPQRIPPPPAESDNAAMIGNLRKVSAARLNLANAEQEKKAVFWGSFPSVDLVGRATFNGVEVDSSNAFADMSNGNHPRYLGAIELTYRFGSDLARGQKALREVQLMEAEVRLEKTKLEEWERLERTARDVKSKYLVAKTANEAVDAWEKAIRQQEKNFRVGRISTAELIQDYNSYFRALATQSSALSDYQITLNEFAAARDRLVER